MNQIEIFYCYAHEDKNLRDRLDKHLGVLKRAGQVTRWYDREIQAGTEWVREIDEHLESANLILLLISPDFLGSDYAYSVAMQRALERHSKGEARVIPIILRPTDWQETPLQPLQVLPSGGVPVTRWSDHDEAFLDIALGIQDVITALKLSPVTKEIQSSTGEPTLQVKDIDLRGSSDRTLLAYNQFTIAEMAKWLELRHANNHRTVLLLGARTGELFRSVYFYETLRNFAYRDFNALSRIEQFDECFSLLSRDAFSATDIHGLLRTSLQDSATTAADLCLAELIKQQHFDEIVTTNIDDNLERAMFMVEMREPREFEIVLPNRRTTIDEQRSPCRVTKVFGDFASRDYHVTRRSSYINDNNAIKFFLQHTLAKDVLAIGIDPIWDEAILPMISKGPGTLWLINEEDISKHSLVSTIIKKRHARTIVGLEGSYDNFVKALHWFLNSRFRKESISNQLLLDISQQIQALQTEINELKNEFRDLKNRLMREE